MFGIHGVDRRRLDQRDADRRALLLELHTKGVGELHHRRLHRAIGPLQRDGAIGQDRADVDDCAALRPKVAGGDQAGFDQSEIADVEHAAMLLKGDVLDPRIERGGGIVDPGVDPPEGFQRVIKQPLRGTLVGDVEVERGRLAALIADRHHRLVEGFGVAGGEDDLSAGGGGAPGGGEADSARSPDDHHHLVGQGSQGHGHCRSPMT
jgi:hypothetical protein